MWELYDRLIAGIPDDIRVVDYICGNSWTMVRADTGGVGLALTGRETTRNPQFTGAIRGLPLKAAAAAAKSWNMLEAGIGVAAINAYYNDYHRACQKGLIRHDGNHEEKEVFSCFREQVKGKKVASVGHFPPVVKLYGDICHLSILERNPQAGDYPEAACEYILPDQDFVFITGVTLVQKTLPRLLTLSQKAQVILVGPVTTLSEELFCFGVSSLCGFVVHDSMLCEANVKQGTLFSVFAAGQRVMIDSSISNSSNY